MLAIVRHLASTTTVFAALVLVTQGSSARHFQPRDVQTDLDEVVQLLQQKVVDGAAFAKTVNDCHSICSSR